MDKIKKLPDRQAEEDTSEMNVWSQSAFKRIPRVEVDKETAQLVEGIISSNTFVLIGERNNSMQEFINTAKSAYIVQDKQFDEKKDLTVIRTDHINPADRDKIKRYLYDTRAAMYSPFASVCGRSFATFRTFAEMVKLNNGRVFVNVMEDCRKMLDESRRMEKNKIKK